MACDVADVGLLPHYNADVTDDPAVAAWIAQVGAAVLDFAEENLRRFLRAVEE